MVCQSKISFCDTTIVVHRNDPLPRQILFVPATVMSPYQCYATALCPLQFASLQ